MERDSAQFTKQRSGSTDRSYRFLRRRPILLQNHQNVCYGVFGPRRVRRESLLRFLAVTYALSEKLRTRDRAL